MDFPLIYDAVAPRLPAPAINKTHFGLRPVRSAMWSVSPSLSLSLSCSLLCSVVSLRCGVNNATEQTPSEPD